MAQHAILRFEKHKGNPTRPLEAHHERQKDQYVSNPDIDTGRNKYNFHIVRPEGRYYHLKNRKRRWERNRKRKGMYDKSGSITHDTAAFALALKIY